MSDGDDTELDLLLDTLEADLDEVDDAPEDFNGYQTNEDESFVTCTSTMDRTAVASMDGTFCSAVSSLQDDASFRTVSDEMNNTIDDYVDKEGLPNVVKNSEQENGDNPKRAQLIPLDFSFEKKAISSTASSLLFGSDSEDDELIEKENLNEYGKSINKSLKSKSKEEEMKKPLLHISDYKPPVVQKSVLTGMTDQATVTTKTVAFDKFFCIRIRNPKVSSITFETLTEGLKKVRASDVRYGMTERFVTIGVITDKSEVRKSANDKDYLMWRIHDLRDCQTQPLKVLLFGECCKEYWKLQVGTCVALLSPEVGDQRKDVKDKQVAVRVFKRAQITDLGFCPSYGTCKSVKADSSKCSNFVNLDTSEFCIYHVVSQVRALSSKRGTFNNISGAPASKPRNATPNGLIVNKLPQQQRLANVKPTLGSDSMRASTTFTPIASTAKVTNKQEEKETLTELMTSRSHLMGARNLVKLTQEKETRPVASIKHSSMADFMKDRLVSEIDSPRLGQGYSKGTIHLTGNSRRTSVDHEAARRRAVELYKKSKEKKAAGVIPVSQGKKRVATEETNTPSKKSKIGSASREDIDKILQLKFMSDKSADKEEHDIMTTHLDKLEKREQVENQVTSCMSLKNVKVFSCKKCNYTAQKRSELCMRSGHVVVEHNAEKRFFKCKSCSRREIAYGLLPSKACQNCSSNDWERVALRDERKVKLDNENLRVRGEEQKFVNR